MIVGLGTDLVELSGFSSQLDDAASHFTRRTFTADEVTYCQGAISRQPTRHLAARYAAKEAAIKALDVACVRLGIEPSSLDYREIEVCRDDRGRPSLRLHGDAAKLADEVGADRAWVTLSHDGDYATAVVLFERIR